jgi:hypothetical protein
VNGAERMRHDPATGWIAVGPFGLFNNTSAA